MIGGEIVDFQKLTEIDKLKYELMLGFFPDEAVTNCYRYGQASILANLFKWFTDFDKNTIMIVEFQDGEDVCTNYGWFDFVELELIEE